MGSHEELIGDTLAMVNVVRQAFGKEALNELPDARPGDASDCLYYRAFGDIGVQGVSGMTMTMSSDRVASAIASLWGTNVTGNTVDLPHQFDEVINLFDGHQLGYYETHRR